MEVTKSFLAERYAAMSKTELMALPVDKLTPEAQEAYRQELARRGISKAEQVTIKAKVEQYKQSAQEGEKELKRKNRAWGIKFLIFCIIGAGVKTSVQRNEPIGAIACGAVAIAIVFLFRKTLFPK